MATIIDVAKLARVSKSTVSRYLNGQVTGRMTEETKARIEEAIEELNYNPSDIARSLKRKSTNVIGLVINDMTNPFFLQMIQGVEAELKDSGYYLLICDSYLDVSKEIECLKMLEQRQIDGIIVAGMNMPAEHLIKLKIKAPVVLLERAEGESNFDTVKIDNHSGSCAAVEHLIEKGHKKIAHIRGASASALAQERAKAYEDCLKAHGLEILPQYEPEGKYNIEGGYEAMKELMHLLEKPTAVFCANDSSAIGALRYLLEKGYRVPEDVAVVGYDDITVAAMVTPPLTTVRQPVMELARVATRILLERINHKEEKYSSRTVVMKSELIIREST